MNGFSHLDQSGKVAMVDVSEKKLTQRTAIARSIISLPDEVMKHFLNGDIHTKKGSVLQTAVIAGIMAAKKTGELIPLCHPIGMDNCSIHIEFKNNNDLIIECTANVEAKTGIEMEALVGASIAALTVYDMCKAMSHDIVIKETRLIKKSGGKNDFNRS